ncbi:MAG: rubrerythrin family protein [Chloroflexi bacterium]|nr:rubrerythrin family protein [Chloroflexota bacterium]
MNTMTLGNLQSAFSGESQAHMRYLNYAQRADTDGFPNVGRLFRAISWAERIHASNHFRELRHEKGAALTLAHAGFGLSTTAENLGVAIAGEEFEVAEMYPAYEEVATLQQEKGAKRTFSWACQAEQTHSALFQAAKKDVEADRDYSEIGAVYVCSLCGHTVVGDAPDRCPICNAPRKDYRSFA